MAEVGFTDNREAFNELFGTKVGEAEFKTTVVPKIKKVIGTLRQSRGADWVQHYDAMTEKELHKFLKWLGDRDDRLKESKMWTVGASEKGAWALVTKGEKFSQQNIMPPGSPTSTAAGTPLPLTPPVTPPLRGGAPHKFATPPPGTPKPPDFGEVEEAKNKLAELEKLKDDYFKLARGKGATAEAKDQLWRDIGDLLLEIKRIKEANPHAGIKTPQMPKGTPVKSEPEIELGAAAAAPPPPPAKQVAHGWHAYRKGYDSKISREDYVDKVMEPLKAQFAELQDQLRRKDGSLPLMHNLTEDDMEFIKSVFEPLQPDEIGPAEPYGKVISKRKLRSLGEIGEALLELSGDDVQWVMEKSPEELNRILIYLSQTGAHPDKPFQGMDFLRQIEKIGGLDKIQELLAMDEETFEAVLLSVAGDPALVVQDPEAKAEEAEEASVHTAESEAEEAEEAEEELPPEAEEEYGVSLRSNALLTAYEYSDYSFFINSNPGPYRKALKAQKEYDIFAQAANISKRVDYALNNSAVDATRPDLKLSQHLKNLI